MTESEKAIEELLLNKNIESAFLLLEKGYDAREITLEGVNIVTGSILANATCAECLSLLHRASEKLTVEQFENLLFAPFKALTPAQAQTLTSKGIEITAEVEKKYSKMQNALILSAQYKPFDFLCKLLEFVCIEKEAKIPQTIADALRKTALNRPIFCTEKELDELFEKCGLTDKNKLYTI